MRLVYSCQRFIPKEFWRRRSLYLFWRSKGELAGQSCLGGRRSEFGAVVGPDGADVAIAECEPAVTFGGGTNEVVQVQTAGLLRSTESLG